jgi:hypothetical protein
MPVAALLDPVARRLPPLVRLAVPLVRSLRDRDVVEAIGAFAYYGALSTARFDKVSHIIPSYQVSGPCQQYAEAPVDGCNAHFAAMGHGGAASAGSRHGRAARSEAGGYAPGGGGGATGGGPGAPGGGGAQPPSRRPDDIARHALDAIDGHRPPVRGSPQGIPSQLLDWLLRP